MLLSTQAAFAMKCKFYGQNATQDPVQRALITDASLARAENSLFKHYPIGKYISTTPARYRDIVYNNQDVAISAIDLRAQKSVNYWGQQLPTQDIQYYQNQNFDWATFQELNKDAQQVWLALKACNQSAPQDLRKNYFTAKLCPNSSEGAVLLKRVQELTMNYFQFLDTSRLIMKNVNPLPQYLDDVDFAVPAQHPLLYQISLQLWSLIVNLANEKPREDAIFANGALSEYYMYLYYGDSLGNYSEGMKNWAKVQYNLSMILAGQDADCTALGLWPAMNRALIFVSDFSYNTSGSIGDPLQRAEDKFEKACGIPVRASRAIPGTYSAYAIAHTFESRRLFLSYFPELKESQAMLKFVKKNTKLTPFNDLLCE